MKYIFYKVSKNECICNISKRFKIGTYEICKINDLENILFIYEGMILIIPSRNYKIKGCKSWQLIKPNIHH